MRSITQAWILSGVWWYGRWLFDPPANLPFDQSLLLTGTVIILFIAYATLTLNLLAKLADRWSAGALEGKSADVAKLLLSFSSLLFLGIFFLVSMSEPLLGVVSVFSVGFLFAVLRSTINGRLASQ